MVVCTILGMTIEKVAYSPLRNATSLAVLITAIDVSYLLQNTATYVTGGQPMTYPTVDFLAQTINVAGTQTKWVVILTPLYSSLRSVTPSKSAIFPFFMAS